MSNSENSFNKELRLKIDKIYHNHKLKMLNEEINFYFTNLDDSLNTISLKKFKEIDIKATRKIIVSKRFCGLKIDKNIIKKIEKLLYSYHKIDINSYKLKVVRKFYNLINLTSTTYSDGLA